MKEEFLQTLQLDENHEREGKLAEGDFLCTEVAVRAMFADQRDISVDSEVLEDMGLDARNADTIKGYRVILNSCMRDTLGIS